VVFTLFIDEGSPGASSSTVDFHLLRWSFDADDRLAATEARRAFVEALRQGGALEGDIPGAELVFGELLGNVVRYAHGAVEMVLDWSGSRPPVLHALDRGPGFLLVPRLPTDLLSENGRGLFLVSTVAEEFNVTPRDGGGAHARVVLNVRERGHRGNEAADRLVDTAIRPFEGAG
jgi:anti-sigma regulatory factor (Ser/Thr protein kinase)